MKLLLEHSWPGNVRELDHAVERAVLMSQGPMVKPTSACAAPETRGRPPRGHEPRRRRVLPDQEGDDPLRRQRQPGSEGARPEPKRTVSAPAAVRVEVPVTTTRRTRAQLGFFGRHDDTTTRRHDVTLVENPKDVVSLFRRVVVLPRVAPRRAVRSRGVRARRNLIASDLLRCPPREPRLSHDRRILLMALASALPGALISLIFLWTGDYTLVSGP